MATTVESAGQGSVGPPECLSTPPHGTALRQFSLLGRSLAATRTFVAGDVVLQDTCALHWDPAEFSPEINSLRFRRCGDGSATATETTSPAPAVVADVELVPAMLAAAAAAYGASPEQVKRVVLDMHAPDLPIGQATLHLLEFAEKISLHFRLALHSGHGNEVYSTVSFAHAMMAAKVNSHRSDTGGWSLFPWASKFAHSCDPSCMYVARGLTATFVAVRAIAVGECISFSYIGGNLLLQATKYRQQRLLASHLFLCQCARCRGEDYSRQIPCPSCQAASLTHFNAGENLPAVPSIIRRGSPLSFTDGDAFPAKVWGPIRSSSSCQPSRCAHSFSDDELGSLLGDEEEIETEVRALEGASYRYAALRELLQRVAQRLGTSHWTYVATCHHFALYFRVMLRNGCSEARHVIAAWAGKYLSGLVRLRLDDSATLHRCLVAVPSVGASFPHMLAAAAIIMLVQSCGAIARYHDVLQPLSRLAAPMVDALYGAQSDQARSLALVAGRPAENSASGTLGVGAPTVTLDTVLQLAPQLFRGSDAQLFLLWERVMALIVVKQQLHSNQQAVAQQQSALQGGGFVTPGLSSNAGGASHASAESLDSVLSDP